MYNLERIQSLKVPPHKFHGGTVEIHENMSQDIRPPGIELIISLIRSVIPATTR
jgi:hypothetical protein